MKKLLFFLPFFFPVLAHADRLGGLKSSADVPLSTQTVKLNPNSGQSGAFDVSSGTVEGPLYILGPSGGSYPILYLQDESGNNTKLIEFIGNGKLDAFMGEQSAGGGFELDVATKSGLSPQERFLISNQNDGKTTFIDPHFVLSAYNCSGNANSGKLTVDASGNVVCADDSSGGGGGSGSPLEVFNLNDGTRSSPTLSIGLSNAFRGSVSGSTYTFRINFSSVVSQSDLVNYIAITTGTNGTGQLVRLSGAFIPNSLINSTFTLSGYGGVPTTRNVNTTSPLAGGGALSGDLTLSVYPTSLSTGVVGSLPAASVAAGNLGSGVLVSSVTQVVQRGSYGSATVSPTITFNDQGQIIAVASNTISAGGGGGSSTLAVTTGTSAGFTKIISSPTAIVNLSSASFGVSLTGGATSYITQNFNWPIRVETARSTSTTAGCAISNPASAFTPYLLCDDTANEDGAFITNLYPYSGGPLYADVFFTMASATSGNVVDTMQIYCSTAGAQVDIDVPTWPQNNSATIAVPAVAGYPAQGTITLSTTGGSCVQGATIIARFTRNGNNGSDTAVGDEEVRGIRIHEN